MRMPGSWSRLGVVLCHDWLTGMRGGERVLEVLCEAFPRAPILTLIHNRKAVSAAINAHDVRHSWIQRVPCAARRYRGLLPLFPAAIRSMRPPRADLLLSTSHCVAKAVRVPLGARHLCYCFTPMRYAWMFQSEYLGRGRAKRLVGSMLFAALRRWDRESCVSVDRFVAISRNVQARIRRFYGRESDLVHPPVDTWRLAPPPRGGGRGGYDLVVSALVPYKRVDLAVAAYTRSGYPLKIVGAGHELSRLLPGAGPNVEFLGWQPDPVVADLYRDCRMLVFPGEEDFGIVPLEAQACGRPVVAYGRGGALETVEDGVTGVFFGEQTAESLGEAVERCAAGRWDADRIRAHAERFGVQQFIDGLAASIERCLAGSSCPEVREPSEASASASQRGRNREGAQ